MNWFRRSPDDFGPFDWADGEPLFPTPHPEPWRDSPEDIYLLPVGFVETIIDRRQLERTKRLDHEQVASLAASINENGLYNVPTVMFDREGKVRYHDGYHRYAAMESLGYFTAVPVRLKESRQVKGYGRGLSQEVESVLKLFAVQADTKLRSTDRSTLQPRRKS